MKLQEAFDSYKENIMPTYTKVPLIFVKGKGSRLWDIHNKVYLDFSRVGACVTSVTVILKLCRQCATSLKS